MRLLQNLVALTLASGVAFGAKSSEEKFQQYHTKALTSAPLKLADSGYRTLTSTPRDYSVSVLLTAMDTRFGCQLCREFQPEWELLARSWTNGDKKGESRTIFATLDFADGRETFVSVSAYQPWTLHEHIN
jgi:oligosaccharyltransferase complex subunit gamma